jgi:lactoylglutathione lyase
MPRICHISIKVDDLEKSTRFYEEVFGFKQLKTARNGQHISRHMTDGRIDFALMVYDSEDSKEAQLSGPGPCIHHIGVEVEDRAAFAEKVDAAGGEMLSRPENGAWKFRAPDGTLNELIRVKAS